MGSKNKAGKAGEGEGRTGFKVWYEKNRDTLSEKRRERYSTDPEYKEKVKAAARRRWHEQREARGVSEPRTRGGNCPRVVQVGHRTEIVFGVSVFAERVGKDVQTISTWEEREIVPSPTVRDEHGRRWYSERHMDIVAVAAKKFYLGGGRRLEDLKDAVWRAWRAKAAKAN